MTLLLRHIKPGLKLSVTLLFGRKLASFDFIHRLDRRQTILKLLKEGNVFNGRNYLETVFVSTLQLTFNKWFCKHIS